MTNKGINYENCSISVRATTSASELDWIGPGENLNCFLNNLYFVKVVRLRNGKIRVSAGIPHSTAESITSISIDSPLGCRSFTRARGNKKAKYKGSTDSREMSLRGERIVNGEAHFLEI